MTKRFSDLRDSKKRLLFAVLILFAGCVVLFALTGVSKTKMQQENPPAKNRLRWHVEKAKKQSKQRVEIPTRMFSYLGTKNRSIDQALIDYTVVVAEPTAKHTVQASSNDLITWYKFNILDILTPVRTPPCPQCMTLTPPKDISISTHEIWIPRNGGKVTIDGVEIEQTEPGFPPFDEGERYLLFLMWYPNQVAATAGGPIGVFKITAGDKLKPFHTKSDSVQEGILSKFQGSLTKLRLETKSK